MISEIGNELVAAYGEACKAFPWFKPLSLRDMVRAENALVGFIAALEAENADMKAKLERIAYERSNIAIFREVM